MKLPKKYLFYYLFFSLVLSLLLLTSCSLITSTPTAKTGDTVKVSYLGTLEDGTIFDSTEKSGKLFEFTLGKKQVLTGFENAVTGLKVGETKEIPLTPAEAYGEHRDDLVKPYPVTSFSEKVNKGDLVNLVREDGREQVARAVLVADDAILVDFNHPLAGKTLHFKITLEEIVEK